MVFVCFMSQALPKPQKTDSITVANVVLTHGDIETVVRSFYADVAADPLLSVPFQSVQDWPHHIERLTHFWWIRFGGTPYIDTMYNPVEKHFHAGFNQEFLARWTELFQATTHRSLKQDQAELWNTVVNRMGHALSMKNEMYKEHYEHNKG